jgi:sirohydrochlorin ferrochelatase
MTVPPGPALERLEDPAVIKALKNALANHGQASVEIVISEGRSREPTSGRITEETVRRGRLQELVAKEPTLGEAVKELDLELLD